MDISNNYNAAFGSSNLSNDQVFYDPTLKNKPLDQTKLNEAVNKDKVSILKVQASADTYTRAGILFSQDPLSALQPSFAPSDQYSLLSQQQSYKAISPQFIEKYCDLGNKDSSGSELDQSA